MEEGGGSKRPGGTVTEEPEQWRVLRSENGVAAPKKLFTRDTPIWLPHATANQPKQPKGDECNGVRAKGGAERLQTITDSQRKFAARFRDAASEKRLDGTNGARIPGSSRWAPRFERPPRTPRGSPMAGRWSTRPPHELSAGRMPLARMICGPIRPHVPRADVSVDPSNEAADGKGQPQNVDSSSVEAGNDEDEKQKPAMIGSKKGSNGDDDNNFHQKEVGGGSEEREGQGKGGGPGGACRSAEEGVGEREGSPGGTDTGEGGGNQGEGREKGTEKAKGASHRGKGSGGSKHTGGLVKGPWTKEEDQKIIDCITQNITKWSEIAERVEGRVGKQCRERWFNHLDPSLKKSSWTVAEDEILVQGQARFGNSWTKIAKLLPGRSENAVKNRWNSAARKKGKKDGRGSSAKMSKMSSSLASNGACPSEYTGPQQVPMLPKQGTGQMHYVPMPSFHNTCHIRPHGAAHAGWPVPSVDMQEYIRPVSQGNMPLSILQARPKHQNHPDQQPPRTLESETVPEQGYRHLLNDQQQVYEQPMLPSAGMPMTQRPFGASNQSRSTATLSPPLNVPTTGVLGISSIGSARPAAADVAPKREQGSTFLLTQPLDEQERSSDSKADSFFGPDDELSLSNTLFNLSLSKTSLGGFTQSFGGPDDSRQDFDEMGGASLGRQPFLEVRGGCSAPRGVVTGSEYPSGTDGILYSDRGLDSCLAGVGLSDEQERQLSINDASSRPRLDFTTSVSELLFAPTQPRAGEFPP